MDSCVDAQLGCYQAALYLQWRAGLTTEQQELPEWDLIQQYNREVGMKFEVTLRRIVEHTATVEVEAEDEEAMRTMLFDDDGDLRQAFKPEWELDFEEVQIEDWSELE